MNIIVVIFIILSTAFLASGVNNLLITNSALSHFAEKSNLMDYLLVLYGEPDIENWQKNSANVREIEREEFLILEGKELQIGKKDYKMRSTFSLCKVPDTFNLLLDENDVHIEKVNDGEIALSYAEALENELSVGDIITISSGEISKELKVAYITKDMVFGSSYMGWSRAAISDNDYDELAKYKDEKVQMYSFKTDNIKELSNEINQQNFSSVFQLTQENVRFTYVLDMLIFAVLIVVAICLLLIAFTVLRFSIVFTLQEDYKEIGIMKAIGLGNRYIRRIYLIKYIFLSIIGTVIGAIVSIPFGNVFLETVRQQMALEENYISYFRSIICAVVTIIIILLFCYFATGKINKYTAMQAIRSGASGERFKRKSVLKLHKIKRMPAICYMAINDILSSMKSYGILLTVFTLGTILVILPANMANTLNSDSLIDFFSMINSDVFITDDENPSFYVGNEKGLQERLTTIEQESKEAGIEMKVHAEKSYNGYITLPNDNQGVPVYIIQSLGIDAMGYKYMEGKAPMLDNEIAITPYMAKEIGVGIGDQVEVSIVNETKNYIITGIYQTVVNMGSQIRLSEKVRVQESSLGGILSMQGVFVNREDIDSQMLKLKELYPAYDIDTTAEFLDITIKTIRESVQELKLLILLVVIFVNCLITILMCKTLITKDIGNIAFLKSIGFGNKDIRIWQGLRILFLMIISLVLGGGLVMGLNKVVTSLTFGMMGAKDVETVVIVQEVYVLYPIILLCGTAIAIMIATMNVKKIGLKELGNME